MFSVLLLWAAAQAVELRLESPQGFGWTDQPFPLRFTVTNSGAEAREVAVPVDWSAAVEIAPQGSQQWSGGQTGTSRVTLGPGEIVGWQGRVRLPGERPAGFYRLRFRAGDVVSEPLEVFLMPDVVAIIELRERGRIVMEFWPDVAPRHVANFVELAQSGFYDALTFHRIIPGFMMQGGCPHGDGTGGRLDGRTVPAEFSDRPHDVGVVSMARAHDPNSASSQFFICFARARHLDGQYSAFGRVIAGQDVVRAVESVGTPQGRPQETVVMELVRIVPRAEWERMREEPR